MCAGAVDRDVLFSQEIYELFISHTDTIKIIYFPLEGYELWIRKGTSGLSLPDGSRITDCESNFIFNTLETGGKNGSPHTKDLQH